MQKFTQLIGCRLNYTQANKNTAIWLGHFSDKQGSKSSCMLISITKERNGIEPWTSKGSLFSSFWTDCAAHQYVWKLVLTFLRKVHDALKRGSTNPFGVKSSLVIVFYVSSRELGCDWFTIAKHCYNGLIINIWTPWSQSSHSVLFTNWTFSILVALIRFQS